jgi:hypothetical protein
MTMTVSNERGHAMPPRNLLAEKARAIDVLLNFALREFIAGTERRRAMECHLRARVYAA